MEKNPKILRLHLHWTEAGSICVKCPRTANCTKCGEIPVVKFPTSWDRDGELEAPAERVGGHLCLAIVTGAGGGGSFPWCLSGKETTCQSRRLEFNPWSRKIPHGREQLSPLCHIYWACVLQPGSCNHGAHVSQLLMPSSSRACAPPREKPLQREAQAWQLEKASRSNKDPTQPKINKQIQWSKKIVLLGTLLF